MIHAAHLKLIVRDRAILNCVAKPMHDKGGNVYMHCVFQSVYADDDKTTLVSHVGWGLYGLHCV